MGKSTLTDCLLAAVRSYVVRFDPHLDADTFAATVIGCFGLAVRWANALAAAAAGRARDVPPAWSLLQAAVYAAAVEFYLDYAAENGIEDRLDERAAAFGAESAKAVTFAVEATAKRMASAHQAPQWDPWRDVGRRERERQSAKRQPKTTALYPC
jgi:hypothetical protein